jgi:hypothetical protein
MVPTFQQHAAKGEPMTNLRYEEIHDWDLKRIVVYHTIRTAAESEGEQESDGTFLFYGVHYRIALALDILVQGAYSTWVPWLLSSKILSVSQEAVVQTDQQYRFTPVESVPTVEEYKEFEDNVRLLSRNYWEWKRRAELLSKIVSVPRPKRVSNTEVQLDENQVQRIREAMFSDSDRLLGITEAAEKLSVKEDYLYHHWQTLPFVVKLGKKQLRFSLRGMQVYLAIMLEQQQDELHGRADD